MKFRLLAQHFMFGHILEKGTEIGDDTGNPLPDDFEPSPDMEALDHEAKSLLDKLHDKLYGKNAPQKDAALTTHPAVAGLPGFGGMTRPAIPVQSKDAPETRPKKPNEEQSPKG